MQGQQPQLVTVTRVGVDVKLDFAAAVAAKGKNCAILSLLYDSGSGFRATVAPDQGPAGTCCTIRNFPNNVSSLSLTLTATPASSPQRRSVPFEKLLDGFAVSIPALRVIQVTDCPQNNGDAESPKITNLSPRGGFRVIPRLVLVGNCSREDEELLVLNGGYGQMKVGTEDHAMLWGEQITVSGWFCATQTPGWGSGVGLGFQTSKGISSAWLLHPHNGDIWGKNKHLGWMFGFYVQESSNFYHQHSMQWLALNQWYHLLAVYSESGFSLYLDGSLVTNVLPIPGEDKHFPSGKIIYPANNIATFLQVGRDVRGPSTNRMFFGKIARVRVWPRPLSSEEARTVFLLGKDSIDSPIPLDSPPKLYSEQVPPLPPRPTSMPQEGSPPLNQPSSLPGLINNVGQEPFPSPSETGFPKRCKKQMEERREWEEIDPSEVEGQLTSANLVGEGAFGAVYKAQWRNSTVAVKVLKGMAPEQQKVFFKELNSMATFRAPCLVYFFAASTLRYPYLLLMEYVAQGSLARLLETSRKGLSLPIVKCLATDVLTGLHYMHQRGFIHRDIKPANVLLVPGEEGILRAKITDFGCARALDSSSSFRMAGTPAYMAPEVLREDDEYQAAVDIYSFGMLLFEMVVGNNPFSRMKLLPLAREVDSGVRPEFPADRDIPLELKRLIEKCWTQDPGCRPSAQEALDLLHTTVATGHPTADLGPEGMRSQEGKRLAPSPPVIRGVDYGAGPIGGPVTTRGHRNRVIWDIARLPDGNIATGAADGTIGIWGPTDLRLLGSLTGHGDTVRTLTVLPGNRLASGTWSNDGRIRIWDLEKRRCVSQLAGHTSHIIDLIPLPNDLLASSSWDNTIRIWETTKKKPTQSVVVQGTVYYNGLCSLEAGQTLAACSNDHTVHLLDVPTGKRKETLKGHQGPVHNAIEFSPQEGVLATSSEDRTILMWDWREKQCIRTLAGHTGSVFQLVPSSDGSCLLSLGIDRTIRIWDLRQSLYTLTTNQQAFSILEWCPGIVVAGTDQGTLLRWSFTTL